MKQLNRFVFEYLNPQHKMVHEKLKISSKNNPVYPKVAERMNLDEFCKYLVDEYSFLKETIAAFKSALYDDSVGNLSGMEFDFLSAKKLSDKNIQNVGDKLKRSDDLVLIDYNNYYKIYILNTTGEYGIKWRVVYIVTRNNKEEIKDAYVVDIYL